MVPRMAPVFVHDGKDGTKTAQEKSCSPASLALPTGAVLARSRRFAGDVHTIRLSSDRPSYT